MAMSVAHRLVGVADDGEGVHGRPVAASGFGDAWQPCHRPAGEANTPGQDRTGDLQRVGLTS